jgi:ABC-type sulfate transport system substrate-binding protein
MFKQHIIVTKFSQTFTELLQAVCWCLELWRIVFNTNEQFGEFCTPYNKSWSKQSHHGVKISNSFGIAGYCT